MEIRLINSPFRGEDGVIVLLNGQWAKRISGYTPDTLPNDLKAETVEAIKLAMSQPMQPVTVKDIEQGWPNAQNANA